MVGLQVRDLAKCGLDIFLLLQSLLYQWLKKPQNRTSSMYPCEILNGYIEEVPRTIQGFLLGTYLWLQVTLLWLYQLKTNNSISEHTEIFIF